MYKGSDAIRYPYEALTQVNPLLLGRVSQGTLLEEEGGRGEEGQKRRDVSQLNGVVADCSY